jgi:hypothetical protein
MICERLELHRQGDRRRFPVIAILPGFSGQKFPVSVLAMSGFCNLIYLI